MRIRRSTHSPETHSDGSQRLLSEILIAARIRMRRGMVRLFWTALLLWSSWALVFAPIRLTGAQTARAAASTGGTDNVRIAFERAEKALASGDYAAARRGFLDVLNSDPTSAAAYTDLGVTYQRMGNLDASIAALEKARSLAPAAPGIDLNLGLAYYRKHEFKRAIPYFAEVVKAHPDNVQAHYLEGLSQFMLNEYGPTVLSLEPIWSKEKDDLDYLFVLGICYGKLKQDAKSATVFGRLVAQGGGTPHLHLLLGKAYLDLREDQKARSELEKAVDGDGRLPYVHYNLGVAYERLGLLKQAGEQFDEEIALDPSQPWAYQDRAKLWVRLGAADKAVPLFQKALKIDPKLASSLAGLGGAYLLEGKTSQAVYYVRQALSLDPHSADFHYQLGQAYLKAKQKAKAQEQFAEAEKLQAQTRKEEAEQLNGHLPPPGSRPN